MDESFEKKEFIFLMKIYSKENIEFGKDLDYLCFRNNCKKENFLEDLFCYENLNVVVKQKRNNEERFALYYIYSEKRGRAYVLKFYADKIRIITIYSLGNKTLKKYNKRKFKNTEGLR